MDAGLMEIVLSLNRSWIYDTYFSLYRPIHTGEKSGGKCPDTDSYISVTTIEISIHVTHLTHSLITDHLFQIPFIQNNA